MNQSIDILGVDIGSVAISLALVTGTKEVVQTRYAFHQGHIAEKLEQMLNEFDPGRIGYIACTTSCPPIIHADGRFDNRVALIAAARHFHDQVGSILIVGGERFGLIRFDEQGNYRNFKANTPCAAGTGSFLDQQARRLQLDDITELGQMAFGNKGMIPKIATRCAVFAKTDLIHAQQEGWSVEEICDGLCHGLAKNIVDTLMTGEPLMGPVLFAGGVSQNPAVVRHVRDMLNTEVITGNTHLYGAIGAALALIEEKPLHGAEAYNSVGNMLVHVPAKKIGLYPPLELTHNAYPSFAGESSYVFRPEGVFDVVQDVEVDIYVSLEPGRTYHVYMGMDIGSTSTKAVLTDRDHGNEVMAGFYTRTAGRPVAAMQSILAAMDAVEREHQISIVFHGVGTTGSGRKFVGKLMQADRIIDEITAHARAAVQLHPEVDTIIEIGGQDAKFTTLDNGQVTFSIMNTVCAAGTGSFIEEQAKKLGCPLSEYSEKTIGIQAPMASDRCTVFMERDLNHYLSDGYSVNEVLAAVLHAIRENYLTKVAVEGAIGNHICFQGATAKNQALVAAFEQKLGKPIHVSRYCHLTGALGTALMLADESVSETNFPGLLLHNAQIPIQSEVCDICANHCKITVAEVQGRKVAYGFLCGRDYDTAKRVDNNRSGFHLMAQRRKAQRFDTKPLTNDPPKPVTIGLPDALHLSEDLAMWQFFFKQLNIATITSTSLRHGVKEGKKLAGADFCAPMTALYGHVAYLEKKLEPTDAIFLPFYLEKKTGDKQIRRQFCYYTQYASALVADASDSGPKIFSPLVNYLYSGFHTKVELYKMLRELLPESISFFQVSTAYDRALEFRDEVQSRLKSLYKAETETETDPERFHVVLLGRPYSVLSRAMNKGIPDIFASLGIKTFYQDMLDIADADLEAVRPMLDAIHWNYAATILAAAYKTAITKGAYPVLITSFKCTPDAFVMEYFKRMMSAHKKPYLILQLDDHDSSVGYETRIEAALRSFANHRAVERSREVVVPNIPWVVPDTSDQVANRTLFIPNWDSIALRMMTAILRREGIDARLLRESDTVIRESLRSNTGQCLPISLLAHEFITDVAYHDLDPARTVLWTPKGNVACNLRIFPHYIKTLLHDHGHGMEKAKVFAGELSFSDISYRISVNYYFAHMFGGLIRKIGCRIRPYEKIKGQTDAVIDKSVDILCEAFSGNRSREDAVVEVVSMFEEIPVNDRSQMPPKPKVAIFGDIYARDNDIFNQDLVHFIEENGGEVVTTPYTDLIRMVAGTYFRKWFFEKQYMALVSSKTLMTVVTRLEKLYYKYFQKILKEPEPRFDDPPEKILQLYRARVEHTGESMENLLKTWYIKKHYPDVALFVQVTPAYCCPSLVTEAMTGTIERITGVPVVTIIYDGTGGLKNDVIVPYLKYPRIQTVTSLDDDVIPHGNASESVFRLRP